MSNNWKIIESLYNGLIIVVDPSSEEILLGEKNETQKAHQLWKMSSDGCIISAFNRKVMSTQPSESSERVILSDKVSYPNLHQLWDLTDDGHLKLRLNDLCIDIFDESKRAGSIITTWKQRSHDWQKWKFVSEPSLEKKLQPPNNQIHATSNCLTNCNADSAKILREMGCFSEKQISHALGRTKSVGSAILFLTENPDKSSNFDSDEERSSTDLDEDEDPELFGSHEKSDESKSSSSLPNNLQTHPSANAAKIIWEMGCFTEEQITKALKRTSSVGEAVLFLTEDQPAHIAKEAEAEDPKPVPIIAKETKSPCADLHSSKNLKLAAPSRKPSSSENSDKSEEDELTSILQEVAPNLKLQESVIKYLRSRFGNDIDSATIYVLDEKNKGFLQDLCHEDEQKQLLLKYQSIEPRPLVKKLLVYALDSNLIHGRNAELIIDAVNQCHTTEELAEFIDKAEDRLEKLQELLAEGKASYKQTLYDEVIKQNLQRKFSPEQMIYALSSSNTIEDVVKTLGKREENSDVPQGWTAPGPTDDPLVQLIPLIQDSPEYTKVLNLFHESNPNINFQNHGFGFGSGFGSKKKRKRSKFQQTHTPNVNNLNGQLQIFRVQNRTLWKVYSNTVRLISEKPINGGVANEKYLFRGESTAGVVDSVIRIGFDVMWAQNCMPKGIWLSSTSCYSVNYCAPDQISGKRRMLLVKCCLGTIGRDDGTNRPDIVQGSNPPQRADCHHCGDNRYVVYNNAQLYPEYIIEF